MLISSETLFGNGSGFVHDADVSRISSKERRKRVVTEKRMLIENFTRGTLLDEATHFLSHCTFVSVESKSCTYFGI